MSRHLKNPKGCSCLASWNRAVGLRNSGSHLHSQETRAQRQRSLTITVYDGLSSNPCAKEAVEEGDEAEGAVEKCEEAAILDLPKMWWTDVFLVYKFHLL